jgi:hypothetical protein
MSFIAVVLGSNIKGIFTDLSTAFVDKKNNTGNINTRILAGPDVIMSLYMYRLLMLELCGRVIKGERGVV